MIFVVENHRAVVKPDLHRVQGVSIPPLFVLMQDVGTQMSLIECPILLIGVEGGDVFRRCSLLTRIHCSS